MSFLSFTRSEKRALLVLLVFLGVGLAVQTLARAGVSTPGYRLVATVSEPPAPARTRAESKLEEGLDPSTAPAQDLELLPGIGPSLALRIVTYRTSHGPFRKPSDLLAVPGLGERLVSRITPYLRFP